MSTFTTDQAAGELGCTPKWLQEQAHAKRVPHLRVGRFYRFTAEHLEQIRQSWEVRPEQVSEFAPTDRSQARRRSA